MPSALQVLLYPFYLSLSPLQLPRIISLGYHVKNSVHCIKKIVRITIFRNYLLYRNERDDHICSFDS